jgi:beta-glucosidase
VVSVWGSIGEMVKHGFAKNNYEAALTAVNAGNDMDMDSRAYKDNLAKLVKEGKVSINTINEAVRRILLKKFEMGLFDDPFKFSNAQREQREINDPEHVKIGRSVAKKSIVLLKNEPAKGQQNNVLPLSKNIKTIALIGPFAKSKLEMLGFWSTGWPDSEYIVSQYDGILKKLSSGSKLIYARGANIDDTITSGFAEAVTTAMQADVVIMSVGEKSDMSGEAKSRSSIRFTGVQEELVKAVYATGKPMVVLINAGRPLIFNWTADNVPAILYTWWLGSEAGNAIADVLFGDYNPGGKLPMSFPLTEGQIPIYYNHLNTGRPAENDSDRFYRSAYIDLSIHPKFPFGYGLSYTTFKYEDLQLSASKINNSGTIDVSFKLSNTGKYDGEEVVQLYLHDEFASVVRPVKELKDFKKVFLKSGESKVLHFKIDKQKLSFYNQKLEWITEPGTFELMIGSSSDDIRLKKNFELM